MTVTFQNEMFMVQCFHPKMATSEFQNINKINQSESFPVSIVIGLFMDFSIFINYPHFRISLIKSIPSYMNIL